VPRDEMRYRIILKILNWTYVKSEIWFNKVYGRMIKKRIKRRSKNERIY